MNDQDFNFVLEDRIAKIRGMNKLYDLEHYASVSCSFGEDSMVNHYLLDIALPNNEIPRVFINTGIEHHKMLEFAKEWAKKDKRVVILSPKVNIKKMLNKEGYPFKSKQHSQNYGVYFRNKEKINEIVKTIENNPKLAFDYDFIHNLNRGVKSVIKYVFGTRESAVRVSRLSLKHLNTNSKVIFQFL